MVCTVTNLGIFYPKLVESSLSIYLRTSINPILLIFGRYVCMVSVFLFLLLFLTAILTGSVAVLRTPVQLVLELSSGLIQTWLIDEQLLVTKLSVKNAILHKIGIANWFPCTHLATISMALEQLVY